MDGLDKRTMRSSEIREFWAKSFLGRMDNLAKTSAGDEIDVTTGNGNGKKYTVLKGNLENIVKYSKALIANSYAKPLSCARICEFLIYFSDSVRKPFKEIKRTDIEEFLEKYAHKSESYRLMFRRTIKPFFRWLYGKGNNESYPKVVSWINCGDRGISKKRFPDILTNEEVRKMIEACDNLRDRALIGILYDTGCRASEILDLKIGELKVDEYSGTIAVSGKTGPRRLRLFSSMLDLRAWLNTHPEKNNSNAPVFCAMTRNHKGEPLSTSSLSYVIRLIAKKAGITKRVFPHLLRHTRLTELAKHLTEQELKVWAGWTRGSPMASVYVHLSGQDIDDKLLRMNGLKPKEDRAIETVPTTKCYRCGDTNSAGNVFCLKCGAPLTQESVERIETVKKIISEVTIHIFEQMKYRKIGEGDLEAIVNEWKKMSCN